MNACTCPNKKHIDGAMVGIDERMGVSGKKQASSSQTLRWLRAPSVRVSQEQWNWWKMDLDVYNNIYKCSTIWNINLL